MNYDAIRNVFGAKVTEKIRVLLEQQEALAWPLKQVMTLCEGYPSDTSAESFTRADDLKPDLLDEFGDRLEGARRIVAGVLVFPSAGALGELVAEQGENVRVPHAGCFC